MTTPPPLPQAAVASTRRNWRTVIAEAGLPAPISERMIILVRSTRLWSREKSEIAAELCAHFADGLAAGRSPESLLSDFGDPRESANLIRRAKKRSRPAWWHAMRITALSAASIALLAVALYGYLAARYYIGEPALTRNYIAEFNRQVAADAAGKPAWPVYLDAIKAFGARPDFASGPSGWPMRPADDHFAEAIAYVRTHAGAVELVRSAAAMDVLGYTYSDRLSPEFSAAIAARHPGYEAEPTGPSENPWLAGVLLPHLGEFRWFARLLKVDAIDAAQQGDGVRFERDVHAVVGLAEQTFKEPFPISRQVGLAIGGVAVDMLTEHALAPDLLDDAALTRLAHRIGTLGGMPVDLNLASGRLMFDDFLQRFFTDDGAGSGRYVHGAIIEHLDDLGAARPQSTMFAAAAPLLAAATPSRRELDRRIDAYVAAITHDAALPMWHRSERTQADRRMAEIMQGLRLTLSPMESLMAHQDDHFARLFVTRDLFQTRRDAAATVLALELFRRREGRWPADLADLEPAYLPALPIDPADGRPLRYRLIDGAPCLYSLGVDADDDAGRPTADPRDAFAFADSPPAAPADGDWVLYLHPPAAPASDPTAGPDPVH